MRRHLSLLILSSLLTLLAQPLLAFEEKDPLINFLDYSKQNSEATYEKVERGLSTIPKNLRQALLENGYSIVIAPTMLSAMPGWQGGVPRGWSEDSNYDNVGGLFQSTLQRIVIPERLQSKQNPNVYYPNNRAELTIRHEFGHAYDSFQGSISHSDDFVYAYTADADKIPDRDAGEYAYFLQPNGAGYTELFAELFAAAYTRNAELNPRYRDLLKAFPRTTQLVLKLSPNRPASAKAAAPQPGKPPATSSTASIVDVSASPASTKPAATSSAAPQNEAMRLYKIMTGLYAQQKYSEAAPVMARYITALEQAHAPAEQLRQAYTSYAGLLNQLHRTADASAATEKARALGDAPGSR